MDVRDHWGKGWEGAKQQAVASWFRVLGVYCLAENTEPLSPVNPQHP